MEKSPVNGGDVKLEKQIVKLVRIVKKTDCDISFRQLCDYLAAYINGFERKYRIPGHDADEIRQECLYALRYKAIEDFRAARGKFKSFAILCMKRHLFSLIKSSTQQKRKVLNQSLSLDEDRNGEQIALSQMVAKDEDTIDEQVSKGEWHEVAKERLMSMLSPLEREVLVLYLMQLSYEEMVVELKKRFPKRRINKKLCDNSLVRARWKARVLSKDPFAPD